MNIKLGSVLLCVIITTTQCFTPHVAQVSDPWTKVAQIEARIKAPVFPTRNFIITEYGAKPDGSDASIAIAEAIEACNKAGGGNVVIPGGAFLTGPIVLKSNVNLHLEKNAVIKFKTVHSAYLPAVLTSFEGMECYNYSPLIYAYKATNIAVTGEGTLDGQATDTNWWNYKREKKQDAARDRLGKMVDANTPVADRRFGEGDNLRPYFIAPFECTNILIEGVKIRNSPMWEISPHLCSNITIRKVDIMSHGPNNDGCDPEFCSDVLIEDCIFDTGDDCIAIKSGRNNDGRRVGKPSENIIIRGCTMKDGHGGVVMGSEISGGVRNVFAENCTMDSPNLDRVLRIKSNAQRGGVIENVYMRNITVGQVKDAILQIDFQYEEGAKGPYKPIVRNVVMDKITSKKTPKVLNITGIPGAQISNVIIKNSTFLQVQKPDVMIEAGDVKLENCVIKK
jgi:polygalacturonase